jgi:hypothetical protein
MKIIKSLGVISLVVSILASFPSLTYASSCVQPDPPEINCSYHTETTEKDVGEDSRYIYVDTFTKKVLDSCGPSQVDVSIHETKMLLYKNCLQMEANDTSNKIKAEELKSLDRPNKETYRRVCPLPSQPFSQLKSKVVDTSYFNLSSIKRYEDGTYGIFNVVDQYEGLGNSTMFDNAKKYQEARDKAFDAVAGTRTGNYYDWAYREKLYGNMGDDLQTSIDRSLSDENNCPTQKNEGNSTTCPLNSALSSNGTCSCDKSHYTYFKDYTPEILKRSVENNDFRCGTYAEMSQALDMYIHGPDGYYDSSSNKFICNHGYIFSSSDEATAKCIPVSNLTSTPSPNKSGTAFTRTLKKGMRGDDVKQLQVLLQKLNYLPSTQVPSVYFGPVTSNAVVRFQRDNKIQPVSGSFGPATQSKIFSLINN